MLLLLLSLSLSLNQVLYRHWDKSSRQIVPLKSFKIVKEKCWQTRSDVWIHENTPTTQAVSTPYEWLHVCTCTYMYVIFRSYVSSAIKAQLFQHALNSCLQGVVKAHSQEPNVAGGRLVVSGHLHQFAGRPWLASVIRHLLWRQNFTHCDDISDNKELGQWLGFSLLNISIFIVICQGTISDYNRLRV